MTISKFSQPAKDYVRQFKDKRIILVDGEEMTLLMSKSNVGVSIKQEIKIQKIDEDSFAELRGE